MFRFLAIAALGALLPAQNAPRGLPTKAAASEYPAHAKAGELAIGAEYLVRSFSGQGRTFATDDYLVVEVALFPPAGETMAVSAGAFGLRINGQKRAILAQNPGFVAASLKYADWGRQRTVEAHAGSGDRQIVLRSPVPSERFPGDRRVPAPRQPPRAPEENRSGLERRPEPAAHEIAVESALLEGEFRSPVAGFLYFPFSKKTKSLKSLELLYSGRAGEAALKLL